MGGEMNIKLQNQQRLANLVNHQNKICKTIYPDDYLAVKESVLRVLDEIIKKRKSELGAARG